MDKRRALVSTIYIFAFAWIWMSLAPRLFPQFFPPPPPPNPAPQQGAAARDQEDDPEEANEARDAEPAEPEIPAKLSEHPHRLIELGSLDPASDYFMKVTVTTAGAAVEQVELNDPRYSTIGDRSQPLKVVGDRPAARKKSLQTSLEAIDDQLKAFDTSLDEVNWRVVSEGEDDVLLSYTAPDGTLEVRKHYRLNKGNPEQRDLDESGYLLDFELSIINLSDRQREVTYSLLGPVGIPLEDRYNAQTYVEIKIGTLDDPGDPEDVSDINLTATQLIKDTDKAERLNDPGRIDTWRAPIKYVGTDVQYFAALLVPKEDQLQTRYFAEANPLIVTRDGKNETSGEWSDLSVRMTSEPIILPAKQGTNDSAVTHSFQVFFGPKRSELLEPLGAGGVKALGWFGAISLGMLSMLHFFHETLLLPYGLAIMLLTIVVRACLFPISRKMALNQKRMQKQMEVLKPKMDEIRTKYADNREKQAAAYNELMAKHGINPLAQLAGCLPMFLQFPIFVGLYWGLRASVDLRMAQFLWIDNLAAPDELFKLPFTIPFLEWTHFNLLPLVTVGLFIAQQKLFMPPATSPEQAMQYKMMSYVTLFFGFIFYKFPAGLCVYFIVSSLWGISERKILEMRGERAKSDSGPSGGTDGREGGGGPGGPKGGGGPGGPPRDDDSKPKPPGLFARLVEAADQARSQTNGSTTKRDRSRDKPGKSKKRRKSKHRR